MKNPITQMHISLEILSGPQAIWGMILKFQSWNDQWKAEKLGKQSVSIYCWS